MVCIQISNGVKEQKLKERLWEFELTLKEIIRKCNLYDQAQETKKIVSTEVAINVAQQQSHRGSRGHARVREARR